MRRLESRIASRAGGRWLTGAVVCGVLAIAGCDGPASDDGPPGGEPYTAEEEAEIAEIASTLATRLSHQAPAADRLPLGEPVAPTGEGEVLYAVAQPGSLSPEMAADMDAYDNADDLANALARRYFDAMRYRYVVALDEQALSARADNRGALMARNQINPGRVYDRALYGFVAVLNDTQVQALESDPAVRFVERDSLKFSTALDHPKGVDRVDADVNPTAAIDGSPSAVGVTVAIIDTGIDLDHADLNVAGGQDFVGSDPSPGGNDINGHGTHCAGIVGATDNGPNTFGETYPTVTDSVMGMAPGVPLWAVRVLDRNGSGYVSDIAAGMDWLAGCVGSGPGACDGAGSVRVANYSIGGSGGSTTERVAIEGLIAAGVTFVAAAGNSGANVGTQSSCAYSPGCYDAPIVVAAMTDYDGERGSASSCGAGQACNIGPRLCHYCTGTIDNCFYVPDGDDATAWYSNYGSQVDLVAPGTCIMSTAPTGGCFDCFYAPQQYQGPKNTLCAVDGGHNPYQYRVCEPGCTSCLPAITSPPQICGYSNQMCHGGTPDRLYCCSGARQYVMMTGTSMAAPHVTGGAALYVAEYYQNHGSYPTHEQVKAGLTGQGDSAPCGAGAGSSCGNLGGKPGLYSGNGRQSMEGSYSPVTMFTQGDAIADVAGAPDPVFEGTQSLLVGVNDASSMVHGYSSVKVCLNEDSKASSVDDYFQARMQVQFGGLVDWTGVGVSGKDPSDTDVWQYWWWVAADGSVFDESEEFPAGTIAASAWHEIEMKIDRRDADPANHTAELIVDSASSGLIPLSVIAPGTPGTDPMRCLFVYTGVQDDTQQEIFVDTVHLSARPEGSY